MNDERRTAIDRFLQGELTLAQLQSVLRDAFASAPDTAASVGGYLDELYQQGRLPLQVHAMLRPLVTQAEADRTARRPLDAGIAEPDMTRAPPAAADRTRLKPSGAALQAPDATRIPPPDAKRTPPPQLHPHGTIAPTGTGSNWSHPEQWTPRHEGPLQPGSVIGRDGRFVLESLLGQGGMGVVYKVLDRRKQEARDRNPYVAMKILSDDFRQHPDALVALQREAVKAQKLAHPNIITVYDFDRDGTTVFMTMELLEGETLSRVIADHKVAGLPKEKAVPLIRAMAEALSYAHKKGIVHSDLKPGNVFLTKAGDVKVLDFGIARAVTTELKPDGENTVFDAGALGALTPAYASAEMLRGAEPAPADDVYALGVIAYELFTGRHPFDRMPADSARLRGLVPERIHGASWRQRRAIAKALGLERSQRQVDAPAFLREFNGPTPIRKSAYAAMAVLAVISAYALYLNTQIRPDVPFETLSAADQERFFDAISAGERALRLGDAVLDDALEAYATAYALHRNNPEAIAGLEAVADRTLRAMAVNDRAMQERAVDRLMCQEYLSRYPPVVEACEGMHGAQRCEVEAARCLARDASD